MTREELAERITQALSQHTYEMARELAIAARITPVPVCWPAVSDHRKQVRADRLRGQVEFVLTYLEDHPLDVGGMSQFRSLNAGRNEEERRNMADDPTDALRTLHLAKLDDVIDQAIVIAASYGTDERTKALSVAERALGQKAAILGLYQHD